MRFIRLVIISIVVMYMVLLGISFLIPPKMSVSRVINIGASQKKLFNTIDDMNTWEQWNHFVSKAPLTNKTISNPSFGPAAFLKSDQLTITIKNNGTDSIQTVWTQKNGKDFVGGFNLYPSGPDSISVQWYFDFHFRWYNLEKFTSLFYDAQFGPAMEESLLDLKHYAENNSSF
ncbi:MAG: hypothetical protein JST58_15835 [Bacteroidetes bacterium]|nr:hypothetical protein [Bacteroidota bacterium]